MKYKFLAAAAVCFSAPLFAQDASSVANSASGSNSTSGAQVGSNVQATGQSASVSQAGADSTSAAGALGNIVEVNQDFSTPAEQTINYNATTTNRDTVGITSNSTSMNTQRYEGSYSVKTVASAIAPSINPSAVCMGSFSASGGFMGLGISGGGSYVDEGCSLRESARLLAQIGMSAGAVSLLCAKDEDIAAAMPEQCRQAKIAVGLLPPDPVPQPPMPHPDPMPPEPPKIEYKSDPVVQPLPKCDDVSSLTKEQYDQCAERGE
jgi:hypothetical protein